MSMQHFLVALDFSIHSDYALEYAIFLATQLRPGYAWSCYKRSFITQSSMDVLSGESACCASSARRLAKSLQELKGNGNDRDAHTACSYRFF